ncbi:MAG: hypothetical protein D6788_03810 [Planctomycetota bacterium]|nr:MAG: hypothetical protein D6788_03810 [Planctomycetota bacterium]
MRCLPSASPRRSVDKGKGGAVPGRSGSIAASEGTNRRDGIRGDPAALIGGTVILNPVEVELPGLHPVWNDLRIGHVSDFHFHRWNASLEQTQRLLLDVPFDFIAVTGDFGTLRSRWRTAARWTRRFFAPIAEKTPVYAVLGNHDLPQQISFEDPPIRFLRNESVLIERNGRRMRLAGVEQACGAEEDLDAALPPSPDPEADFTVLLAHYPSTVFRLPPGRVTLQLSGHTHGGQIRLPGLGCVWPNDAIPRQWARGLRRVGGTWLHVTPGIGMSPPLPVRLWCPPEVSRLTIRVPVSTETGTGRPVGISSPAEAGVA